MDVTSSSCRSRSTQHTNFGHAKQTKQYELAVCPALPVKESLTPELSGQWSERSDIRYYANRSSFTGGVSSIRVNQMVREMSWECKGSVVLRMKVE